MNQKVRKYIIPTIPRIQNYIETMIQRKIQCLKESRSDNGSDIQLVEIKQFKSVLPNTVNIDVRALVATGYCMLCIVTRVTFVWRLYVSISEPH